MMLTRWVRKDADWMGCASGNQMLMLSVEHGEYVAIGGAGPYIWDLLQAPHSEDEICHSLLGRFDVPAEICRAETTRFISQLAEHDMIRTADPVAPEVRA